jgi:hypothetical protein
MNAVVFPKCGLHRAVAGMGTELAHEGALSSLPARQGHKDPPAFIPVADDAALPDLADGLDDGMAVTAWMMETGQRRADFLPKNSLTEARNTLI